MSNEGIVMSDRDGFSKLVEELLLSARDDGVSEYGTGFDYSAAVNTICEAAVEHCKQGEPTFMIIDHDTLWRQVGESKFNETPDHQRMKLFAHAMPKSEDKPVFGKLFSETIGEYSPTVLGKFDSFASDTIKRLVDIHAGTEIADCIAGLTWRLSIVEQRDEILSNKVIELSTPQPTTDISELVAALNALANDIAANDDDGLCEHAESMMNARALIAKHTVKA
jgi:hypothetical protein